eukprot:TRINITY_DN1697_c0_g1_i5.p1 TRINITY_DN1697_c0_g1~~TRINITY_DN1697_c0_g1_i5.p1  ORF type:complete len:271 (-),score=41.97 TRINITY_DN1697_c0_g1_i5:117-833(-)
MCIRDRYQRRVRGAAAAHTARVGFVGRVIHVNMDAYEVLGVDADATDEQIRRRYLELARTLHPDKASEEDKEQRTEKFVKVQWAWGVLSQPDKRREHDLAEASTDSVIWREVDLDDMLYDEADKGYSTGCKCGGRYLITEDQLEEGFDATTCDGCSGTVVVLYEAEMCARLSVLQPSLCCWRCHEVLYHGKPAVLVALFTCRSTVHGLQDSTAMQGWSLWDLYQWSSSTVLALLASRT